MWLYPVLLLRNHKNLSTFCLHSNSVLMAQLFFFSVLQQSSFLSYHTSRQLGYLTHLIKMFKKVICDKLCFWVKTQRILGNNWTGDFKEWFPPYFRNIEIGMLGICIESGYYNDLSGFFMLNVWMDGIVYKVQAGSLYAVEID